MVRAILGGTKTQTRRVVKPQPHCNHILSPCWGTSPDGFEFGRKHVWIENGPDYPDGPDDERRCPYGVIGDRLWVRETWASGFAAGCWGTIFAADGKFVQGKRDHKKGPHYNANDRPPIKWRPSIFLPRWASRITLEITDVRVERLNDISEDDGKAEGVSSSIAPARINGKLGSVHCFGPDAHRKAFGLLWDAINGKRAPWASNPWVWVIEFRRLP